MKAPTTTQKRTTPEQPKVHTGLTVNDVDTINACQDRILHNAILLRLHLDPDASDAMEEFETFEALRPSLEAVAARIVEDATLIHVTVNDRAKGEA